MTGEHSKSEAPTSETVAIGCEWTPNGEGQWDTSCEGMFEISNGDTPTQNGMKFCCYCGLRLDEMPYEEEEYADE
jgi:hypothetical protein